ncbi:MAG: hypothetical protein JOZ25_12215 [Actinobacteria bacterium]|nr:hypothetical protein [Actinomycetota bacterium]
MASGNGERPRRVDVGFAGGQAITLRVTDEAYNGLRDALASNRSDRWYEVESDDAAIAIDLSQVVYVRRETAESRVGFRGV